MEIAKSPKYSCSSKLMEAVRALNYLGQYKVCFTGSTQHPMLYVIQHGYNGGLDWLKVKEIC